MLRGEIARGRRYFVRQTFIRGWDSGVRAAFLVKGYEDEEKVHALEHLATLSKDAHAHIYDVTLPDEEGKLLIAARQPAGYHIYYAAKKGSDWQPPEVYREKVRRYIQQLHPAWKRGQIQVGMHEEFGELFLQFNYGEEVDKLPFDEIEKY